MSLVVESGVTVKETQELARHSTPQLTMNVYASARTERLSEAVERVGEVVLSTPKRVPSVYRLAVGAEQETATPSYTRGCGSVEMVEAAGIEPHPDRSPEKTESAQNSAKSRQFNALDGSATEVGKQKTALSSHDHGTSERPKCATYVQQSLPADLQEVVSAWDSLTDEMKAQIVAMVKARG